MILEVVLFLSAAVLTAALYYRLNYSGRLIHKIPGPKGVPVFGNVMDILLRPDQLFSFVRDMHRDHGDITALRSFYFRMINLYAPADIEVILSATKFNRKRLPYSFLVPWLGRGLLLSNGEKWHHRRKMLTPTFHFNILKKFARIFNDQTAEFVDSVQGETVKDKTEILPFIVKYTLRVICETAMGTTMDEDIRSVSNKYFSAIHLLGQCIIYRVTRFWLYSKHSFAFTEVAFIQKKALKDLHSFTKQIIRERREFRQSNNIQDYLAEDCEVYGKKSRVAMLDLLLDQEKQGKIDEDGIREEVDTFMFEGHDTISTALYFMMMRIANEPEIQEKIYAELNQIFGDSEREPTMEDLAEMKYLECCIKESLRLYPSVPYIARYITEDVVLSGYKVPAKTVCNIHIFDIHRRADIYPDPEKFIPEFLPENIAKRHPYSYIPFSAGPRNCIGQKFAFLEMKTPMSGVLRRFRLEPVTRPEDCRFACDMVLRVKDPMYVRFRDRKRV